MATACHPIPSVRHEPATAPSGALPRLITRCAHRAIRGILPSEKLRGPVGYTFLAQRDVMLLLEFSHRVESFEAWTIGLPVCLPSGEEVTYWPEIGIRTSDGRRVLIDIIRDDDAVTRAGMDFDTRLARAAEDHGFRLLLMPEASVRNDPRLRTAAMIWRCAGFPVTEEVAFEVRRTIASAGGAMSLGEIRSRHGGCRILAASGCVLAMRRRLALALCPKSEAGCTLSILGSAA